MFINPALMHQFTQFSGLWVLGYWYAAICLGFWDYWSELGIRLTRQPGDQRITNYYEFTNGDLFNHLDWENRFHGS